MVCNKSLGVVFVFVDNNHLCVILHEARVDQLGNFNCNKHVKWHELIDDKIDAHKVLDSFDWLLHNSPEDESNIVISK